MPTNIYAHTVPLIIEVIEVTLLLQIERKMSVYSSNNFNKAVYKNTLANTETGASTFMHIKTTHGWTCTKEHKTSRNVVIWA